jgi:adenylate cyclase
LAVEIERKFLIVQDKLPALENGTPIEQGYIPTANKTTVRVRITGNNAFLCVKSPKRNFSRLEFEFAIPVIDAREMLGVACHAQRIEKLRYLVPLQELTWEVDVFLGANKGLIVAEVELQSEDQSVPLPEWIEEEVTEDNRYSNYALAMHPYNLW